MHPRFVGVVWWCAFVVPRALALATRSAASIVNVCDRDFAMDCPEGAAAQLHCCGCYHSGKGGAGVVGWTAVGDGSRCLAPIGYEGPCGPLVSTESYRSKADMASSCAVSCPHHISCGARLLIVGPHRFAACVRAVRRSARTRVPCHCFGIPVCNAAGISVPDCFFGAGPRGAGGCDMDLSAPCPFGWHVRGDGAALCATHGCASACLIHLHSFLGACDAPMVCLCVWGRGGAHAFV